MKRRKFIPLLAGAALWPLAAGAQRPAIPVVGFLSSQSLEGRPHLVAAFREGLRDAGYIEGENFAIEYRSAQGRNDLLPGLAAELVRRPVAVIAATGGTASGRAAKEATATIPIVFTTGEDPVRAGLVVSVNRPGANVTGIHFFIAALSGKRLELLRALVPNAEAFFVLRNPQSPEVEVQTKDLQQAAHALRLKLGFVEARTSAEIDAAFNTLVEQRAGALVVQADPFFNNSRARIVRLAEQHAIPAMYFVREFPVAGGLVSYGTSQTGTYREAGVYVARILKGEKPAEMPVLQSTKFELVINLKTAKTVGIEVPANLLALADEVIE